jgi:hypothetical protein
MNGFLYIVFVIIVGEGVLYLPEPVSVYAASKVRGTLDLGREITIE